MATGEAQLVLGPTRSGKSEWAEHLARASGLPVTYVATGREDPNDAEWCARLAAHRRRRPADWHTLCAADTLPAALAAHDRFGHCLLVDALGGWVAARLAVSATTWADEVAALRARVSRPAGQLVLVGEETGWGIVPADPSARLFRDRLGAVLRTLGPCCAATWLVVGGFALALHRWGIPVPPSDTTP